MLFATAAVAALAWGGGSVAVADTPDDTLVMASQIADIITLDPAEIFEFSGAEYAAQVSDRPVTYDVNNGSDIQPMVAASWEVDRKSDRLNRSNYCATRMPASASHNTKATISTQRTSP